jgi:hypothetical protein
MWSQGVTMQQSEASQRDLRAAYTAIVAESFASARHCLSLARAAQKAGDYAQVGKWMWSVRVLRMAAAEWRKRAQFVAPMFVCLLWCFVGCTKAPLRPREFSANFEVQPSADGGSVVWSLQFKTREQYHAFLDTTADGTERAKVRELIAAGFQLHHIVGCSAQEKAVTRLGDDGIAFIGSCPLAARAVPAGGI